MPDTQPTTDQDAIDAAQAAILSASDCYRENFYANDTLTCCLMSSQSVGEQVRTVPMYAPNEDGDIVAVGYQSYQEPWQDPATVTHDIVMQGAGA